MLRAAFRIPKSQVVKMLRRLLRPVILGVLKDEIQVWGPTDRLSIAPTAQMVNTLFNTSSGRIEIGDWTFAGHNVSVITGTHRSEKLLQERIAAVPNSGRDVIVGRGFGSVQLRDLGAVHDR